MPAINLRARVVDVNAINLARIAEPLRVFLHPKNRLVLLGRVASNSPQTPDGAAVVNHMRHQF